jgi:hypothetical protein
MRNEQPSTIEIKLIITDSITNNITLTCNNATKLDASEHAKKVVQPKLSLSYSLTKHILDEESRNDLSLDHEY